MTFYFLRCSSMVSSNFSQTMTDCCKFWFEGFVVFSRDQWAWSWEPERVRNTLTFLSRSSSKKQKLQNSTPSSQTYQLKDIKMTHIFKTCTDEWKVPRTCARGRSGVCENTFWAMLFFPHALKLSGWGSSGRRRKRRGWSRCQCPLNQKVRVSWQTLLYLLNIFWWKQICPSHLWITNVLLHLSLLKMFQE